MVVNFGWLAAGESVAKLVSFAAFVYLARTLGPETMGLVEYPLAVLYVLNLAVDFGFGLYGAREIAKDRDVIHAMTRRVIATRLWFTVASLVIIAMIAFTSDRPEVRWLLLLFGLSLLPAPLLLHWVFQGCDLMHLVSIAQVLRYTTFGLVIFGGIREASHLWLVPVAELCGVLVAAAFMIVMYWRRFGSFPPVMGLRLDVRLIAESLAIGLSHFMWAARYVFVTVLLYQIAADQTADKEVGLFATSLRIVVALHMFVTLYIYNLLPSVSRLTHAPRATLRLLLSSAMRSSTWVSVPLCLVAMLGARPLIHSIYSPRFDESVAVFQLLVWMLATALLSAHHRVTLIAFGRQGLELVSTGCGAALNLALIFLLYQPFGIIGVALAMLIGELITFVFAYAFVEYQITTTRTLRALWPPTVVAVAATIAAYLVGNHTLWLQFGVVLFVLLAGFLILERRFVGELATQLFELKLRNHKPAR